MTSTWYMTDRARKAGNLYAAGVPIAKIAEHLGLSSRDPVYADLHTLGIYPGREREPWWHPNYLGHRDRVYWYKPFEKGSPRPELPAPWNDWEQGNPESHEQYRIRSDHYYALHTAWRVAMFGHDVAEMLPEANRTWKAYTAALSAVDDVMNALGQTPDNMWRAALFRVTLAHDNLLRAAQDWDRWCASYWACLHGHRIMQLEDSGAATVSSLGQMAKDLGINADDWDVATSDYDGRTRDVETRIAVDKDVIARVGGDR